MKEKKPIRLVIREIMDEKRLKPSKVAERLGKQRQFVYDTLHKRDSMSIEEIEEWAIALDVKKEEILFRLDGTMPKQIASNQEEGYLMGQVRDLRETLDFYKNQLTEKDLTIRALSSLLLGKVEQVFFAGLAAA